MLDAEGVPRSEQHAEQTGSVESLSARESEVLEMASHGLTNLEIGSRLGVSVHAVKFHLAAVYRKLGVHNRTEAVVLYVTAMRPTREVS
jgi:DNA-binding CsgD family transcriptional regulator